MQNLNGSPARSVKALAYLRNLVYELPPQLELRQPNDVEWYVIIHCSPRGARHRRKARFLVIQLPLAIEGAVS